MIDLLLLCGVGAVAGTLNVLAGGGSLLTLPLLIFVGLPPTVANGTNRVAILVQNLAATHSFRQAGRLEGPWVRVALPPTLAGALAGGWAGSVVGDVAYQRILALVMVAVAAWMVVAPAPRDPDADAEPPGRGGGGRLGWAVVWVGVGFYGGFIQAGLGFVILAVVSAAGLDLVRGNALKVALVLAFTPFVLAVYAWNGLVDWRLGAALAVGAALGGRLGARLAVFGGGRWLRALVTTTVVVFALRLWFTT